MAKLCLGLTALAAPGLVTSQSYDPCTFMHRPGVRSVQYNMWGTQSGLTDPAQGMDICVQFPAPRTGDAVGFSDQYFIKDWEMSDWIDLREPHNESSLGCFARFGLSTATFSDLMIGDPVIDDRQLHIRDLEGACGAGSSPLVVFAPNAQFGGWAYAGVPTPDDPTQCSVSNQDGIKSVVYSMANIDNGITHPGFDICVEFPSTRISTAVGFGEQYTVLDWSMSAFVDLREPRDESTLSCFERYGVSTATIGGDLAIGDPMIDGHEFTIRDLESGCGDGSAPYMIMSMTLPTVTATADPVV